MRRRDLVRQAGQRTGIPQYIVKEVFGALLQGISDAMVRGERVELRNFGIFTPKKVSPRLIVHPRTGRKKTLPAMTIVRFRAGKELKKSLT